MHDTPKSFPPKKKIKCNIFSLIHKNKTTKKPDTHARMHTDTTTTTITTKTTATKARERERERAYLFWALWPALERGREGERTELRGGCGFINR